MSRLVLSLVLLFFLGLTSGGRAGDPAALADKLGRLPSQLVNSNKTDVEAVEALFLATLGRLPTEKDQNTAQTYLKKNMGNRKQALGDVLLALVNTKEFFQRQGLPPNPATLKKLEDELMKVMQSR